MPIDSVKDGPDFNRICAQGRLNKNDPEQRAIIDANIRYLGEDSPGADELRALYGIEKEVVEETTEEVVETTEEVTETVEETPVEKPKRKKKTPTL